MTYTEALNGMKDGMFAQRESDPDHSFCKCGVKNIARIKCMKCYRKFVKGKDMFQLFARVPLSRAVIFNRFNDEDKRATDWVVLPA